LRSVELEIEAEAGGVEPETSACPYCGGVIDSRSSRTDSSEIDSLPRQTPSTGEPRDGGPASDWVQAWSRGSLGSLGRFQLRERLGDGGFGMVFRAYDPRLDRDVAIKVLKQSDPSERVMERFFREARAVARLDHPNIAAVHDAGFEKGRCWVAYQLVSGRALSWYRDHQRMDAPTAVRMIRDLADSLDHSHRMGVVHRDIKPANVIIDDQARPRLIDFGLARRSDIESDLTREGAIVGTPAYMSPEQALGLSRQVDERADVYSLGVIFFELLTGRRPDERTSPAVGAHRAKEGRPAAGGQPASCVRSFNPAIPRALEQICSKAMATDPADRYASARALAEALEAWSQRASGAGRWTWVAAASCLAATTVLILMAGNAFFWRNGARLDRDAPKYEIMGAHAPGTPARPLAELSFVGSKEKRLYHRHDCETLRMMKEQNRVRFAAATEAELAGYRRCARCLPEGRDAQPSGGPPAEVGP
jgi:hypothetical protein